MKMINLRFLLAACAAFFVAGSAAAQTAGTVTNHAFAIGKGAGQSGFASLLCAATEVAIGQSAANPACHALTGDVTMTSGGVVSIGAGKVTNSMLAGSIAASKLVGTDIATVGTITSGTWQATPVAVAYGGTGATTAANARTNLGVAIGTNVQAWDADLDCLATLSTAGVVARTGAGTCATRTVTAPAAGITVSNGDGVAGNPTLALANDLAAVEGLSGTGIARRTGTDTWAVGGTVTAVEGGFGADVSAQSGVPLFAAGVPTFTGTSGTGTFARVTSPTFTTPNLGTPSAVTLTNGTGLPLSTGVTGTLQATNFPALTGDVTSSAGSLSTTISNNAVTNAKIAMAGAATLKGNPSGSAANVQDFTIQALTPRGSPDAANDKLVIYDNSAGTLKYVTPAQIASSATAGVSSLNGLTGGLTLSASIQMITASGTYTPSAGLIYAIIECIGGGGAGGGVAGATTYGIAAGSGGAGAYSRKVASAATIGASQAVTIGAGGAPGAAGANAGGNGGQTSVGALCTAPGGSGGGGASSAGTLGDRGSGGAVGTGDLTVPGAPGSRGQGVFIAPGYNIVSSGGAGANSPYGSGGDIGVAFGNASAGLAATGYGAGGGGAAAQNSTATAAGGAGAPGLVIITEYRLL